MHPSPHLAHKQLWHVVLAIVATLSLTLIPLSSASAADRLIIDSGHVDAFNVSAKNGQLKLELKEDVTGSDVKRAPETVELHVKSAALHDIPQGVPGYPQAYYLPLSQDYNLLWPGWDTLETQGQGFDGSVKLHFDKVSGPGDIHLFQFGTFGGIQPVLQSGSTQLKTGEVRDQSFPAHTHADWIFTKPGVYTITVHAEGTKGGQSVTSNTATYTFTVGDDFRGKASAQPAPSVTPVPTAAPTTVAPKPAPTTAAPTTVAPKPAPTTAAPTTAAPKPAPTTAAPTTVAPKPAPTTAAPKPAPTTVAPTTVAPTTVAPTTVAPKPAPTTVAPKPAPTTVAPTTAAPKPAPTTAAPTTVAPTTAAPKPAPTTAAPTTVAPKPAPTTVAPKPAPTTAAPTTVAPKPAPTTAAPKPAPTTAAPTTVAPTTVAPKPAPTTAAPLVIAPSNGVSQPLKAGKTNEPAVCTAHEVVRDASAQEIAAITTTKKATVSGSHVVPSNTHVHPNWVFSKPGTYELTVRQSVTAKDGKTYSDTSTLTFNVGSQSGITSGHFDFGARFENGKLTSSIKDDRNSPAQWIDPSSATFALGDAAKAKAPQGIEFVAPAGADVWMVPSAQIAGVPWVGVNSMHPSIISNTTGEITQELVAVKGPGNVGVFTSGNFGTVVGEKWFSATAGSTSTSQVAEGRAHAKVGELFKDGATYKVLDLKGEDANGKSCTLTHDQIVAAGGNPAKITGQASSAGAHSTLPRTGFESAALSAIAAALTMTGALMIARRRVQ